MLIDGLKPRLRAIRALLLPGVLLALVSFPAYPEGALATTLLKMGGLVLLIVAAGGRVWAGVYVVGRKNRTLVTEGPFSIVRNPLYFFSFLAFVGAGLSFGSVTIAAVFALTFFVTHWSTIRSEEAALEDLFGNAYLAYCSEVPRFVPALRRPRTEPGIGLEASALVGTLRESVAIPMVFVLAQLVEWAKVHEFLPVLFRIP